ncbi:MAG: hypothetical protein H6Q90_6279 [Deltaproteobacteria bacterium]|nr:hypothetical protein [Deltaproteobacteria bacterium]
MGTSLCLVAGASLAAGCGAAGTDDGGTPIDAGFPIVDIDNGSCGDQLRFTGEYVDWDHDATACGIEDALFQVAGDGAMDITAPNGRFDLCIPSATTTTVEISPAITASQCTVPGSTYPLPAIAVVNKAVILAGALWSGRNFTIDRQQSLFQAAGLTFDPAKAQVFVHLEGPQRPIAITAAHGTTQAMTATAWAAGDTGHEVFFPNVDVGGQTTMLTVTGGALGTGPIPLAAGKITTVTLIAN